jgi:hypothetical protein
MPAFSYAVNAGVFIVALEFNGFDADTPEYIAFTAASNSPTRTIALWAPNTGGAVWIVQALVANLRHAYPYHPAWVAIKSG